MGRWSDTYALFGIAVESVELHTIHQWWSWCCSARNHSLCQTVVIDRCFSTAHIDQKNKSQRVWEFKRALLCLAQCSLLTRASGEDGCFAYSVEALLWYLWHKKWSKILTACFSTVTWRKPALLAVFVGVSVIHKYILKRWNSFFHNRHLLNI